MLLSFGRALFLLSLFISSILAVPALDEEFGPLESSKFRLRLDYGFATRSDSNMARDHTWMVSTHLTFRDPVSQISDEQLLLMVRDASKEIEPELRQYLKTGKDRKDGIPGAMGILAFGQEIILVSSYRGGQNFIEEFQQSELSDLLQQCTATFREDKDFVYGPLQAGQGDNTHKNLGHCGEVMAMHLYARSHQSEPLHQRTDNPRAVTINVRDGAIIPPCGKPKEANGCDWIVQRYGVKYLDATSTEDYDLEALRLETFGQLRACE